MPEHGFKWVCARRENLPDAKTRLNDFFLANAFGQYTPSREGRSYGRKIEPVRSGRVKMRLHMHDIKLPLTLESYFKSMPERHLAGFRKIRWMKDYKIPIRTFLRRS